VLYAVIDSQKEKMANTDIKSYLTHNQMILTNNQGFRFQFNIPTPGNVLIVHIGNETFHIGQYPPEPPSSPSVSDRESDDSSSLVTPPNEGGGPNEN